MPVLRARVLSPLDPDNVRFLEDALVVVDGTGRIADVRPPDGTVVDEDLRPGLLVPGFVDAHLHYPQIRMVGRATGPLLEWLEGVIFPEEALFADPEHAATIAELFCCSLAAAGTTMAVVYGSVHPEATDILFQALDRSGLRAIAGPVLMDAHCPEELKLAPDVALPALEALVERWHGHDGRLQVAVIPRFALSCSEAMLEGAGRLSRERGLLATAHLAENPEECALARERFGTPDYLTIYERAGLVHQRSIFAHCVHLSESEWDRFAVAGAAVAHCPDSNFFLGSGQMPWREVARRGIHLSVGTDIAAGRTFRVPRILSSAYDNAVAVGTPVDPRRLLWWGTRGGALALGETRVGAIERRMSADLALYDLPDWLCTENCALSWLLFDHDAPRPRRTWVRGRVIWDRDGGGYPWTEAGQNRRD
jgi:guanine deaminase